GPMRSMVACLVVFSGVAAATTASAQSVPATGSDVYHVHFAKASPGQAAALGKFLMEPDKTSPMPTHFIVLRHQEGDDWDYVVIQHLGAKAEGTATATPPTDPQRPVPGHREQLLKSLSTPGAPSKIQTGNVLLTHLEGADWTFATITRYNSWQ